MGLLKGNDQRDIKKADIQALQDAQDQRQKDIYKQAILEAREEEQRISRLRLLRFTFVIVILISSCFLALALLLMPSPLHDRLLTGYVNYGIAATQAIHVYETSTAITKIQKYYTQIAIQGNPASTAQFPIPTASTRRATRTPSTIKTPTSPGSDFSSVSSFAPTSLDHPAPAGQVVLVGPVEIQIIEAQSPAKSVMVQGGKQSLIVFVKLTCKTKSDQTCTIMGHEFSLVGSKKIQYKPQPGGIQDDLFNQTVLYGGGTKSGWLVFGIDPDETKMILIFDIFVEPGHAAYLALP